MDRSSLDDARRQEAPSASPGHVLVAATSIPVLEKPEGGSPLVTELVPGESLGVVAARDGWLQVVVPGHANHLDGRGYPGWTRPDGLVEAADWRPDLMVVARNDAGLPLGALLQGDGEGARLPDGGAAFVAPYAVRTVGAPVGAAPGEISQTLLGLPYRWGGTDSTVGMDCSGMVFRVMQLLGVSVPRDADDQFERAPFKSRESWEKAETGDLVFFGKGSVTHVGFYLGDGAYISERSAGTTVCRVEDDPYWGFARYF